MTTEELAKISGFLDNNQIEELKYYIECKKIGHFNQSRQYYFENYLENVQKQNKTILFEDKKEHRIICSNGISLYYINSEYIMPNSPRIIHNQLCQRATIETIQKLEQRIEKHVSELTSADWWNRQAEITRVEHEDGADGITHDFKTLEIVMIDRLLGKATFKLDKTNPVLYAESEVGHAYVLGLRKPQI